MRRNPTVMLKVLEEACGHPPLVKAQKLFLTGSRGRGRGWEMHYCPLLQKWATERGMINCVGRSQLNISLLRMLGMLHCTGSYKSWGRTLTLDWRNCVGRLYDWADDDVTGEQHTLAKLQWSCSAVDASAQPDPILLELREAIRRQDHRMKAMAKEFRWVGGNKVGAQICLSR